MCNNDTCKIFKYVEKNGKITCDVISGFLNGDDCALRDGKGLSSDVLFFVKSSETKIDFHQELLTTACPFCIFAFESGLKVANQQPCRKGRTVILHCNFKNAVTMSNFFNNGNQAIINNWSEEELLNQVINAANNGRLKILK